MSLTSKTNDKDIKSTNISTESLEESQVNKNLSLSESSISLDDNETISSKVKTKDVTELKSQDKVKKSDVGEVKKDVVGEVKSDVVDDVKKEHCPFLVKESSKEKESSEEKESNINDNFSAKNIPEEESLFKAKCKLYFHYPKTGRLEERGTGLIKILIDKHSDLHTIVMIRDILSYKGAYHNISPSKSCALVKNTNVEYSWCWSAINDCAEVEDKFKSKVTLFLAKFTCEKDFDNFKKFYELGQKSNGDILSKRLKNKI